MHRYIELFNLFGGITNIKLYTLNLTTKTLGIATKNKTNIINHGDIDDLDLGCYNNKKGINYINPSKGTYIIKFQSAIIARAVNEWLDNELANIYKNPS